MIAVLQKGGLLAFPTDTVFGLGCIVEDKAISRVYEVKGRSFDKPLPMMCDSLAMMKRYAHVDERVEKIYEHFMPGALTLILKKKESVPSYATLGKDTIGIRVPDDEFILGLIADLGVPLMVTSANISGNGSLLKWQDVLAAMDGKIEAICMEDATGENASTIIDLTGNEIKVLRQGPLSIDEIREAIR